MSDRLRSKKYFPSVVVAGFTPTKGPLEPPKTVSRDIIYSFKSLAENLPKRTDSKKTDSKTNESKK